MNRYYAEPGTWKDTTLTLTDEEAHHASRVMREKQGGKIEIFDGNGRAAICDITHIARGQLVASILSTSTQSRPNHSITLCQAIPKGSNMDLIIQKSVELGVSSIQPLITAHTIAKPDSLEKKRVKWQRTALEACKQCGQNYLPEVRQPLPFSQWLEPKQTDIKRIIAALDPAAVTFKSIFDRPIDQETIELLIGPEGDFSPEEYQQAYDAHFTPVSLGDIVLRVETATLYCLSVLRHELTKHS